MTYLLALLDVLRSLLRGRRRTLFAVRPSEAQLVREFDELRANFRCHACTLCRGDGCDGPC